MTPRLVLRGITKRYSRTIANEAVSLDVMPGEIVALLGENGAGKTTLMKIACGVTQPDAGTIAVDGKLVEIDSPRRARSLGIAMVFQQFALFDSLTVLQNVALGVPGSIVTIRSRLTELATSYGLEVDPDRYVHDLSAGERQRIEIVRALLSEPRVLILDEPTSVLTPQAAERLFETLRVLSSQGVSIVFISHKLHEVRNLATRCVVMRAGKVVAEVDPRSHSEAMLARLMLGADEPPLATRVTSPGAIALEVDRLSVRPTEHHDGVHQVSFQVRSGEIVGIAGISGNGQASLMAALAGELAVPPQAIQLFGQPVGQLNAAQRRTLGLRYVPEQRLGQAVVASMTLAENTLLTHNALLAHHVLDVTHTEEAAAQIVDRFQVRASAITHKAETLSGGNLQKFIVGREILPRPRVLLLEQPTSGIDAGSAVTIHNELNALCAAGCAIVIVSEDWEELYQLADRLMVMAGGRLSPPRIPADLSVAELGRWMAGSWPAEHHRPGSEHHK
ncbi:MAG TPA: ABC transporter ATP-binding protein [Burkholderiaceae bacterium]|nr:ABC transporter ATP-binding protein [Burkholderiaceae bacterium]